MRGDRIQEIQATLDPKEALLIEKPVDLFYLVEEEFSAGSLLIDKGAVRLFLDGRYEEVGKKIPLPLLPRNEEVLIEAMRGYERVLVDGSFCTLDRAKKLEEGLINIPLVSKVSPLMKWRLKKDLHEQKKMAQSAEIASLGYEFILGELREGISEKELAMKLTCYFLGVHGAQTSFDPIIAFGENSALPHAKPTDRRLKRGDIVLLDFGAKKEGFCSDMTRTFCYKEGSSENLALIEVVKQTQEKVIEFLRPGILASELDQIAHKLLEEAGYGSGIKHSLGHGIGLEVHEMPILRKSAPPFTIEEGMCITIEPGVYLEGVGGCRIEDTLFVTASRPQMLTRGSKEPLYV